MTFLADPAALDHLPGRRIDLAFIDGMHLFEYALRDFINVERVSHPGTVIVLDDMLPRRQVEAARNRTTTAWTGDVFKMIPVLTRYRPDLLCLPLNTAPTGVMLVLGADAENRVLSQAYDEIVAEWVTEDPQTVPAELLDRSVATAPAEVLEAGFWPALIGARRRPTLGTSPSPGTVTSYVRRSLAGEAPPASDLQGPPEGRLADAVVTARRWGSAVRRAVKPRTRLRRLQRRLAGRG